MKLKYGAFVHRWYEELENGNIYGVKCKECENIEFPPYYACSKCGGHEMEWVKISGKGELFDISNMMETSAPVQGKNKSDVKAVRSSIYNSVPGAVRTAEGNERNMRVFGINEINKEEIFAMLPVPVEAFIVKKTDPEAGEYPTVAWRYSGPGSMTDDEYAKKKGI